MDVAKASDVLISKKRMRETAGELERASVLGTVASWGGVTLAKVAQDAFSICSCCRSLLFRPACNPFSQKGTSLTKQQWIVHQPLSTVLCSASSGCIICKLAIAAKPTLHQDTGSWIDGFKFALYWFDGISKFDRIDVTPVNHLNKELSFFGYLNAIRLVSEDGIGL